MINRVPASLSSGLRRGPNVAQTSLAVLLGHAGRYDKTSAAKPLPTTSDQPSPFLREPRGGSSPLIRIDRLTRSSSAMIPRHASDSRPNPIPPGGKSSPIHLEFPRAGAEPAARQDSGSRLRRRVAPPGAGRPLRPPLLHGLRPHRQQGQPAHRRSHRPARRRRTEDAEQHRGPLPTV